MYRRCIQVLCVLIPCLIEGQHITAEVGDSPMSRQVDSFVLPRSVYTCGQQGREPITNFVNPNYPSLDRAAGMCQFRLVLNNTNICQVRVDFVDTRLAGPVNGVCSEQYLSISGSVYSMGVERLCGINTDQHFYVEVKPSNDVYIDFIINTNEVGLTYKFGLWITEIDCTNRSVLQAPRGCFQYYLDPSGIIKSFNYEGQQYMLNMRYRICIRNSPGVCSVAYTAGTGEFNLQKSGTVPASQRTLSGASRESCSQDFLVILEGSSGGNTLTNDRYCGGVLSGVDNSNTARPVTAPVYSSLIQLEVRTGGYEAPSDIAFSSTHKGFKVAYAQNTTCAEVY